MLVAREDFVDFGTGKSTKVWTYNGGIPGPTIRGKLGDTLIVHFYNQLPEETTIHSIFQSINESEGRVRERFISRFSESVHEWF